MKKKKKETAANFRFGIYFLGHKSDCVRLTALSA